MSDLKLETRGPVARLEIQRAPNNHVDPELISGLADALEALDGEADVRVTVISSAGKNFCAGADLRRPQGVGDGEPALISPLYQAAGRLFQVRKPMIAAVQGAAVGAGLGLALACDFRVAGAGAKFSANFVKLGFHPGFGLSATLPRALGPTKAAMMLLTGRRFGAEAALALGLVDVLSPDGDPVPAALALAAEIAEAAPLAVEATRATLRAGLAEAAIAAMAREHAEQTRLMRTEDFKEGVRSVAERRAGAFVRR